MTRCVRQRHPARPSPHRRQVDGRSTAGGRQSKASPTCSRSAVSPSLTLVEVAVATGRFTAVVDDVNDVQRHIQRPRQFAGEYQRGPTGRVTIVSDNQSHGDLLHCVAAGTISLDGGSGSRSVPGRRSIALKPRLGHRYPACQHPVIIYLPCGGAELGRNGDPMTRTWWSSACLTLVALAEAAGAVPRHTARSA